MIMDQIHIRIGQNLKNIRKQRNLSLEQTAEITGVSKAMLAQIERGDSSPSISTVWKIANGLRLTFSALIDESKPEVAHVRKSDLLPLTSEDGKFRSYPLFPFEPDRHVEIYYVEMDPDSAHESEAHPDGVEEFITMAAGTMELRIGDRTYVLQEGDALRFAADRTHQYRNVTKQTVRYHSQIFYP